MRVVIASTYTVMMILLCWLYLESGQHVSPMYYMILVAFVPNMLVVLFLLWCEALTGTANQVHMGTIK